MKSNLVLITPYYKTDFEERNEEIDRVLEINLKSNLFDRIILFCDHGCVPPFENEKIEIINSEKRPTYLDFFIKGNQYEERIIVISNSDIFFNQTILFSEEYIKNRKEVLALTRYEYYKGDDGKYKEMMVMGCDSQDSWIYFSPINIDRMNIDFGLGLPGCDNRIAKELSKNYIVRNPSYTIKTYHVHESNIRNYNPNERLEGEYLQVHME